MSLNRVGRVGEKTLVKYSSILSLFVLVLALMSYLWVDMRLSLVFNDEELMTYRKLAKALTDIGLGENSFFIAIITYLLFTYGDKKFQDRRWIGSSFKWLKSWSLNYFFALIFSGAIGQIIKFLVGRQRPHMSETFEAHHFDPMNLVSYNQSMPSGHAQVLFCSATMLAILWPKKAWLIYPIAAALTFTRIVVHAHFLSDVIVGGLVGHLGTLWCIWLLQKYYPHKYSLSSRNS